MVGRAKTSGRKAVSWALLPVLTLGAAVVQAQGQPQTELSQAEAREFDIAAQGLSEAMIVFARQSGLQVSVASTVARNVQTTAVRGRLMPRAALAQMLAGTGLVFRVSGSMVAVEASGGSSGGAMQLDPVHVQGAPVPPQAMIDNLPPPYAGGQVATGGQLGLLGNRDVMDTPFNQTNYTAKKAQDQQAKTIRDVLLDDPSARISRTDNGPGADQLRIRGFAVDGPGYAYGGLYGILPYYSTMVELAERVEVLKGPSAMLNGMPPFGYIGGTINVVPKRAPDEPLTQATANYASAGQVGGHIDFARRFGPEKEVGVRFNGVFRAGRTDLQYNSDQRGLGVLGLDFRGDRVRLSADLGFQTQYIGGLVPYLGLGPGVALPWAPNVRNNPTAQPWGYQDRRDLFGVVRAEVDLVEAVTAYAAFGAHDYRLSGLYSASTTITSFYGAATNDTSRNTSIYTSQFTAEAGVRARADTGPIAHELAVSGTGFWQDDGQNALLGGASATNIYNPAVLPRPNIATPVSNRTSTMALTSFGFADTLSVAEKRIQLTAGVRLQRVQSTNFDPMSGAATNGYDQSAFSPSVAVVFKPLANVTVYGNWIQGLQPGAVVQQPFANAGDIFPPYKSTQFEAGVKVDWGKLTTTASIFQISQPSILTDTVSNTQFLGGEQINQGLELNFFGEMMPGVRVLGGAMFLNAVLAKTQGGLTDGWTAPFSPGTQLNLGAEWDLPFAPGLTLTGRAIYTGSQYIDALSPRRSLPDWTRFDIGARYSFENPGAKGKLLAARFNVDNVFDSNYWAGGVANWGLFLGAPRTFRLSLTADF